jgi:hypothetical protein
MDLLYANDSTISLNEKLSYKQLLISQFKKPDRLINRLFDKNFKKLNNIKKIYEEY